VGEPHDGTCTLCGASSRAPVCEGCEVALRCSDAAAKQVEVAASEAWTDAARDLWCAVEGVDEVPDGVTPVWSGLISVVRAHGIGEAVVGMREHNAVREALAEANRRLRKWEEATQTGGGHGLDVAPGEELRRAMFARDVAQQQEMKLRAEREDLARSVFQLKSDVDRLEERIRVLTDDVERERNATIAARAELDDLAKRAGATESKLWASGGQLRRAVKYLRDLRVRLTAIDQACEEKTALAITEVLGVVVTPTERVARLAGARAMAHQILNDLDPVVDDIDDATPLPPAAAPPPYVRPADDDIPF
jgi:hypothetical protein